MLQKIENGRENLLRIGRDTLIEKGYGGVSVSELTKLSGMGVSTFYNYFKSKDDLIYEIVVGDWNALLKKVRRRTYQPRNNYENIRYLYRLLSEFQRNYRFFGAGPVIKSGAIIRGERENLKKLCDLLTEKLREDEEAGTIRFGTKPEIMSYMIVQSCMAASRNPDMGFDDLWSFLHAADRSCRSDKPDNIQA